MARGARQHGTVERTIRFFRIDAGVQGGHPIPFHPKPTLDALDGLKAADRYLEQTNRVLLSLVDSAPGGRLRFATIRRTDLPATDNAGTLVPLSLPIDQGLAECIQLVFFPNQIVGADFNFYGPQASTFGVYHNLKVPGGPSISIDPLLRQDVSQQLGRLADVRFLRVKIRRQYTDQIKQASPTLGRTLEGALKASGADQAEIVLSPRPYSRTESLDASMKSFVRKLARRKDLEDNVRALQVRGYDPATDTVEEVDILRAHLLTTRQVVKLDDRSRSLDPDSAYHAIREAHKDLADDISRAAAVFAY